MQLSARVLAGLLLAGVGVSVGGGRAPSVDMVSGRYSDALPNPTHLGHWVAPVDGRAVFVTANAMVPGTGAGSATFGVMVLPSGGSSSTICTLSIPCTSGPSTAMEDLEAVCDGAAIPIGAEVHLEYSDTCTTAPEGNAVFGFEWNR